MNFKDNMNQAKIGILLTVLLFHNSVGEPSPLFHFDSRAKAAKAAN